jgi:hypothetical protein
MDTLIKTGFLIKEIRGTSKAPFLFLFFQTNQWRVTFLGFEHAGEASMEELFFLYSKFIVVGLTHGIYSWFSVRPVGSTYVTQILVEIRRKCSFSQKKSSALCDLTSIVVLYRPAGSLTLFMTSALRDNQRKLLLLLSICFWFPSRSSLIKFSSPSGSNVSVTMNKKNLGYNWRTGFRLHNDSLCILDDKIFFNVQMIISLLH